MKVASFFSGCGGLDLGFKQAGFDVVWANEIDTKIHATYELNNPEAYLCKKDIREVLPNEIPECDGFIGGPPCQSWSLGGRMLGLKDERGKLFLTYISLITAKKPKFFVIENVEGIISDKHFKTFKTFIAQLRESGYKVFYELLDAANYRIPQNRKRVFIIGIRSDLNCDYVFPNPTTTSPITLRRAISDISIEPQMYLNEDLDKSPSGKFYNHDCYTGPFDAKFMARNRVRNWDELSFTIQAQAKNCPLHPQAPKMSFVNANLREFVKGYEHLYRRFSVRECARIQSFPDSFKFIYNNVVDGYKMVGNAVPPRLAYEIAKQVKVCFANISENQHEYALIGYYKNSGHLNKILSNKLYYVRTGFTYGGFIMPEGINPPNILILHNRNKRLYFKLSQSIPKEISAKELREMGFTPHNINYLAFNIIKQLNKNESLRYEKIDIKRTRDKVIPYLIVLSNQKL